MNPNLPLANVVCAGYLKFVTIWYEKKPQHVEDRKINIACCCEHLFVLIAELVVSLS